MTIEIQIIATILDCSEEDAEFLVDLCCDFETNFKEVWQIAKNTYIMPTLDDFISIIYCKTIDSAILHFNKIYDLHSFITIKIAGYNSSLSFNKKECTTYASLVHTIESYFKE